MDICLFFVYISLAIIIFYLLIRRLLDLFKLSGLERKAVLITGCDSGFGHMLALKCLNEGMPVFAGCLSKQGADLLECKSEGMRGKLRTVLMDVSKDDSVKAAVATAEQEIRTHGGLHAVVNNAGIVGHSFYDDFLSVHDYQKVSEVNLWGAIRVAHATKNLVKMARGRIVNILSVCARVGIPGIGPYTVSKFGLAGYSDMLRQEMRSFGVSVHVLEPGFFATDLTSYENTQKSVLDAWNNASTDVKNMYGEKFYKKGIENSSRIMDTLKSPHIEWVVNAYFHAVTAVYPRIRYHVGRDLIFFFLPFSFLPSYLQDVFFRCLEVFMKVPQPQSVADPNWVY